MFFRIAAFLLVVVLLMLAAVTLVLLLVWPAGWLLQWLLGLDVFQAQALALGALLIVSVLLHAVVTGVSRSPWSLLERAKNQYEEEEYEDEEDEEEDPWLAPCPCDSGRPFSQCCGRRAYQRYRSS